MRVKCVICDTIEQLDDDNPVAKKLRNRPIHTFMCDTCKERITAKTETRIATGKYRFFRTSSTLDQEF